MNRKGKKSPLIRVKNTKAEKAKPKRSSSSSPNSKRRQFVAKSVKSKQKRSLTKAVTDNNPRLKKNLIAKKSTASASSDRQKATNKSIKTIGSFWLAIYVVIIVVGISTILGTIVSLATFETATPQTTPVATQTASDSQSNSRLDSLFEIASLGKEIVPLKSSLQQLVGQYRDLEPKVFVVDLDTKGFVSIEGEEIIASASTIKIPILVAFFQDVDRGKISLEERLIMTEDSLGGGSGTMQYLEPGTKFSALETASKMMTISDNTATNMLIERMGGIEKLNQRFIKMGLKATRLRNPLPDLTGTNTTTAEDLGNLLAKIDTGELISLRSRDRLLYIMRNLVRNTLLPVGLEPGAMIAHKTGDIKSVLGDAGIIDMPNGKRYIASVLVKRPDNSPQAKEFIQKASGIVYQYFEPQTAAVTSEEEE